MQQYSEKDTQTAASDSVTQLLRVRAYAREVEELLDYAEMIGLRRTQGMRGYIEKRLENGMEMAVLQAVLDETAMAPRPSWPYFCAIIKRFERVSVRNMAQFYMDKAAWHVQRRNAEDVLYGEGWRDL